ncbi:MAG: hypothetical protein NC416_03225 [Eubacterium sp.]|nr:hypothetical protein [Eubacterium sp.]
MQEGVLLTQHKYYAPIPILLDFASIRNIISGDLGSCAVLYGGVGNEILRRLFYLFRQCNKPRKGRRNIYITPLTGATAEIKPKRYTAQWKKRFSHNLTYRHEEAEQCFLFFLCLFLSGYPTPFFHLCQEFPIPEQLKIGQESDGEHKYKWTAKEIVVGQLPWFLLLTGVLSSFFIKNADLALTEYLNRGREGFMTYNYHLGVFSLVLILSGASLSFPAMLLLWVAISQTIRILHRNMMTRFCSCKETASGILLGKYDEKIPPKYDNVQDKLGIAFTLIDGRAFNVDSAVIVYWLLGNKGSKDGIYPKRAKLPGLIAYIASMGVISAKNKDYQFYDKNIH